MQGHSKNDLEFMFRLIGLTPSLLGKFKLQSGAYAF